MFQSSCLITKHILDCFWVWVEKDCASNDAIYRVGLYRFRNSWVSFHPLCSNNNLHKCKYAHKPVRCLRLHMVLPWRWQAPARLVGWGPIIVTMVTYQLHLASGSSWSGSLRCLTGSSEWNHWKDKLSYSNRYLLRIRKHTMMTCVGFFKTLLTF